MVNLALIARTVLRAEAAQRASVRWAHAVHDAERQISALRGLEANLRFRACLHAAGDVAARRAGVEAALEHATKNRRAAYARWTNAQATLAANPLPGDAI